MHSLINPDHTFSRLNKINLVISSLIIQKDTISLTSKISHRCAQGEWDAYYWGRYYSPHKSGQTHNEYAKYSKYSSTVLYKKGADKKYYSKFSKKKDPKEDHHEDGAACPQVSCV